MKRLEWIDTLKGIGIILMVAGHAYGGRISDFINIFNMPLFFFIGGFLYSSKYDRREYFQRKFIHLIIPYITFTLLLYPLQLITLLPEQQEFSFVDLVKLIVNPILGGSYLWGLTTAFWFITCFFITQQLADFLIKTVKQNQLIYYIFLMTILGYVNNFFFKQFWLPQNSHVVLATTPIFLIGFLWKNLDSDKHSKKLSIISLLFFVFVLLNIFYSNRLYQIWTDLSYDMKRADYGLPVLSLMLAIGMIVFLIELSKLIATKTHLLSKILSLFGESSMIILSLHMAFIYALKATNLGLSIFYLFVFSTILSLMVYLVMVRFSLTRAIFLGSYSDFGKIFLTRK